jgi:pilus assembly protein CpaF
MAHMNIVSSNSTRPNEQRQGGSARAIGDGVQQHIKTAVHKELIKRIDLDKLGDMQETPGAQQQLFAVIQQIINEQGVPLSAAERDRLAQEVVDEVFGLGPLEPLLKDDTISDILVNTCNSIYVERRGVLEKTSLTFQDNKHLLHIIDKIVSAVGRRVDESSPMVDARLPDGSRVNVIIPPLAVDGPILSIRRFGSNPLGAADLLRNQALTPPMLEFLSGCVKARLNIIISGGTGSGKTTLLNTLSSFISEKERIVTIEDSAELQLRQEHVVRLETRPPNVEGKGSIRQRELVINALRMRPDRVVLGEVRGEETLDMLQAMNTGHDGSLATIHANSPRDAITRLESMVLMGSTNLPEKAIKQQIANAIHLIIQASRLSDGRRCITNITELSGMQGDVLTTQEIFAFEKSGVDSQGRVHGAFRGMGLRPRCLEIITTAGGDLSRDIFDHRMEV